MKALLIKSNHGNHSGFNRHWFIEGKFDNEEEANEKYLDLFGDHNDMSLEYIYIINEDDYFRGIFDGGHMGYPSKEIVEYFES